MRIVRIFTSILLVMSSGSAADELPRVQPKEVGLSEKVLDEVCNRGSRSSSAVTTKSGRSRGRRRSPW